jgi:hypothetical protein
MEKVHGVVDRVHGLWLTGLLDSLNMDHWFSDLHPRSITAKGYFQVLILDAPSTMDGQDLMDVEPLCDYKGAAALRHGGAQKNGGELVGDG